MKIVLNFHLAADVRIPVDPGVLAALRARFPALTFTPADDAATLAREMADADVFFGFHLADALVERASRLRWIQSASAGIEQSLTPAVRARDIRLTNGAGIAAAGIAEHVLGVMLAFTRHLHVAVRLQAARRWDRRSVMLGTGTPLRDFAGSRVVVLGLGPIGLAVGARASALGAIVRGLRRRPQLEAPPAFERVVGREGLDDLLRWGDFVVVAVPHTADTERMIGARELALLRREAHLVNIARGSVIDETALVDTLRRGAIAGAGLDVFEEEPLPSANPLWELPNVIITPHVSGSVPRYLERAAELFTDNLERFLSGRPLRNEVDKALGYPT